VFNGIDIRCAWVFRLCKNRDFDSHHAGYSFAIKTRSDARLASGEIDLFYRSLALFVPLLVILFFYLPPLFLTLSFLFIRSFSSTPPPPTMTSNKRLEQIKDHLTGNKLITYEYTHEPKEKKKLILHVPNSFVAPLHPPQFFHRKQPSRPTYQPQTPRRCCYCIVSRSKLSCSPTHTQFDKSSKTRIRADTHTHHLPICLKNPERFELLFAEPVRVGSRTCTPKICWPSS
jgi:hypothetical protein